MLIAGLTALILIRGMTAGGDVYGAFLRGAERGMKSAAALMPTLCAMLLMLGVLNASGVIALLTRVLVPVLRLLRLPEEVTPLLLLRPLTGSGSLAALEQILRQCGPDSRAGMLASVMMGSSETIFYTMTVYLGAAGVRRLKWVIPVSLISYLAGVIACAWIVR